MYKSHDVQVVIVTLLSLESFDTHRIAPQSNPHHAHPPTHTTTTTTTTITVTWPMSLEKNCDNNNIQFCKPCFHGFVRDQNVDVYLSVLTLALDLYAIARELII